MEGIDSFCGIGELIGLESIRIMKRIASDYMLIAERWEEWVWMGC